MKRTIVIVTYLLLHVLAGKGQPAPQDKLALEVPLQNTYTTSGISSYVKSNFSGNLARVRALFVWVANNVGYDVEKARLKSRQISTVADVLTTRKAVCQGYAELFVALCKECSIDAILIPGYVRLADGTIADLSHAWVAAAIDKQWFLFDPTWAAGSIKDGRFIPGFSNRYYKVMPQDMIKDHMPFDPMYQFLNYPLTYDEFNHGATVLNTARPFFNYTDTISRYATLDTMHQLANVIRRINSNGTKNPLVYEMLHVLNSNEQFTVSKSGFDGAVAEFNKATIIFNQYIDLKNKRFAGIKDNKEVQQLMDSVLAGIHTAYTMLASVTPANDENSRALQNFNSGLSRFYRAADDENIFLKRYFQNK